MSFWDILVIAIVADGIERQQRQTNEHLRAIRNQAWLTELEVRKQDLQWELNEAFRRRYGVTPEEYYERHQGFPSEVHTNLDQLAKLNEAIREATHRPTQPMFVRNSIWQQRPVLMVTLVVLGLFLLGLLIAVMANTHGGAAPQGSHVRRSLSQPESHRHTPRRRRRAKTKPGSRVFLAPVADSTIESVRCGVARAHQVQESPSESIGGRGRAVISAPARKPRKRSAVSDSTPESTDASLWLLPLTAMG